MSSYPISISLNPKRVFILQKSELEKRLDPFIYVPELLELENKVLAGKPKKNSIRNLILGEYFTLPIPVPPLDKQIEIAKHITDIQQQAQQLKNKKREALRKASDEIEKLLLN